MFKKIPLILLVASASVCAANSPVDLSKPFICPDVSPVPMRITERGLVMGGVVYPLYNPNASSTPKLTNAIFRSADNMQEIDVVQYARDGSITVSYMKFSMDINMLLNDAQIEKATIFEKGSFEAYNPSSKYYSKNQGCRQAD